MVIFSLCPFHLSPFTKLAPAVFLPIQSILSAQFTAFAVSIVLFKISLQKNDIMLFACFAPDAVYQPGHPCGG